MSTRLCMLVIWVITSSACVSSRPDEPALASDAGDAQSDRAARTTTSPVFPSPPVEQARDASVSHSSVDAGSNFTRRGRAPDPNAQLDAQTGTDEDAGIAALAVAIELDCRETLRCNAIRGQSLPACISSVTEALASAAPEARERFQTIVMRCEALRACAYVGCVQTQVS